MRSAAERSKTPVITAIIAMAFAAQAQTPNPPQNRALKTPLKSETLNLLANEVSGQRAFNNLVKLAGAPWIRDRQEFSGTFYETQQICDLARSYGAETARIERYAAPGTFEYAFDGDLWTIEPARRRIATLAADPALIGRGSTTADITAELVYIAPLSGNAAKEMAAAGVNERTSGKLALMWSHPRDEEAKALDAAGVRGVIAFSAQDRYGDPAQVIYSGGLYAERAQLKLGMTVSWRQWSELLEDVQSGRKVVLRARTQVEKFPNRIEAVFVTIPGTEPDAKGVIFTGHLFEGYTKRGANDDMSGCVIQLEILRSLNALIARGELPRPRRSLYFLWPNEISGTYEFIKQHPGFSGRLGININMDMVGEGLRKNNAVFTMSECPDHLPSYFDGLAKSILNYVWRTNDIVYLPDAPRGRPGGQDFPAPMVEKNGSMDAFRYFIHRATGGSDHICFNNPSVAVPGIEFFVWPDQWYHTDKDTPDKADPTEMKRVAFIGAATAWVAANCTDDVLPDLVDAVSDFGYARVAEREIPRAMARIESAGGTNLNAETVKALNLIHHGTGREIAALRSIAEIGSGSEAARTMINRRVQQWEIYRTGLQNQVLECARAKGGRPATPVPDAAQEKLRSIIPAIDGAVKGSAFSLGSHEPYTKYMKEHPEALKAIGLTPQQASTILNYVNGKRSVLEIRDSVAAELDEDVTPAAAMSYLELLRSVRWVTF
jgi:aminopeptidase YwaD